MKIKNLKKRTIMSTEKLQEDVNQVKEMNEVEKVLKEPVFLGHDTNAKVVRAQLFLVSAMTVTYISMGLEISADSSFLGLKFNNLNEGHIQAGLLVILIYQIIHFVWLSWDALFEWRLRITGTKTVFSTGMKFGSGEADFPDDPRQSTLYNFYYSNMLPNITKEFNKLKEAANTPDDKSFRETQSQLNLVHKQLNSRRLKVSINRFDNWYKYFLISQNLRWLVIEFGFPIILAASAITLLCNK